MDLLVLNTDFEAVAVVDDYESFIWTDRFRECGDFEMTSMASRDILEYIKRDYYIVNRDSEHVMIVESIRIKSDAENGDVLTVKGRSLESILDRRVVYGTLELRGNLEEVVEELIKKCIIEPAVPERIIENFVFQSTNDPAITSIQVETQYTGDNLYNVISNLCAENEVGFKITLSDDNKFVFSLYTGVDRSYRQDDNPYVVFSPSFDNLLSSNYIESVAALKNVAHIGGEVQNEIRIYAKFGDATGLDRREMFVDARNVSSKNGDVTLSAEEYDALLTQRGKEKLAETSDICSFEGEVEAEMYKYGVDYNKGDIVQLSDGYGHESYVRIVEIVMSDSENGHSLYPTFEIIKEKGE